MQPTKRIPPDFELAQSIDLSKSPALAATLSLAGLALFLLLGWLGAGFLSLIRPEIPTIGFTVNNAGSGLLLLGALLGLTAFTVTLHEVVHGLFFWLFTGERPVFGWKWLYAYAAAPDWYLPRNLHLVVAAAPFVLITGAGLALLTFLAVPALPAVLFATVANAVGSIGDITVIVLLIFRPQTVFVRDTGDAVQIYE